MVGGEKSGILRFCGRTDFASGVWCGVELHEKCGKSDGSVAGVTYFKCLPGFGMTSFCHDNTCFVQTLFFLIFNFLRGARGERVEQDNTIQLFLS